VTTLAQTIAVLPGAIKFLLTLGLLASPLVAVGLLAVWLEERHELLGWVATLLVLAGYWGVFWLTDELGLIDWRGRSTAGAP
jgi:hypothetical protein